MLVAIKAKDPHEFGQNRQWRSQVTGSFEHQERYKTKCSETTKPDLTAEIRFAILLWDLWLWLK